VQFFNVNGVRISKIGLGTWQFGSADWAYGDDYAGSEAARIVTRALDLGVNLIDTAEIYGDNYMSELVVGQAIAGRRADALVATKYAPIQPTANVIEAHCRDSARRLGVDQIDLYQLHWPSTDLSIEAQMRELRALHDRGLVRDVGVSNYSLADWQEAERAYGGPVLANQVEYSLAFRDDEAELLPYAREHDRLVIAYSPLAKGLLSGRFDANNVVMNRARARALFFSPENLTRAEPLLDTLRAVADAHDATPAQVALAWVISHENVVAIPGASSVAQLESNIAAADLELTADELERLTSASDAFTPIRDTGDSQ
jgi:aryl-alcohol dehydrogenase-like predicted oxidoreductase